MSPPGRPEGEHQRRDRRQPPALSMAPPDSRRHLALAATRFDACHSPTTAR